MSEKLEIYGESYDEHRKRVAQIFHDLDRADIEKDRPVIPGVTAHTTSSPRMLEAMLNVELKAMVRTNPNLTEDQRQKELNWLQKMAEEEAEARKLEREEKIRKQNEDREKWFTED